MILSGGYAVGQKEQDYTARQAKGIWNMLFGKHASGLLP